MRNKTDICVLFNNPVIILVFIKPSPHNLSSVQENIFPMLCLQFPLHINDSNNNI